MVQDGADLARFLQFAGLCKRAQFGADWCKLEQFGAACCGLVEVFVR